MRFPDTITLNYQTPSPILAEGHRWTQATMPEAPYVNVHVFQGDCRLVLRRTRQELIDFRDMLTEMIEDWPFREGESA